MNFKIVLIFLMAVVMLSSFALAVDSRDKKGIISEFGLSNTNFSLFSVEESNEIEKTSIGVHDIIDNESEKLIGVHNIINNESKKTSDSDKKIQELKANAEKGDAQAQYWLGNAYSIGQGVDQNDEEAIRWFRKASIQNHPEAQFFLWVKYDIAKASGSAVSIDEADALNCLKQSANSSFSTAQVALGKYYALNSPKNYELAVAWYRKAAEQGDTSAQFELGYCYYSGLGIPKDYEEAVAWYRKSVRDPQQGEAQLMMGVCYHKGHGVTKDQSEAVKWYRRAAENDEITALYNLGVCYEDGSGVKKDIVESYAHYNLAGVNCEEARKSCQALEKNMTSEQIVKGQERTKKLKEELQQSKATKISEYFNSIRKANEK